jgi:hypothetical protein
MRVNLQDMIIMKLECKSCSGAERLPSTHKALRSTPSTAKKGKERECVCVCVCVCEQFKDKIMMRLD